MKEPTRARRGLATIAALLAAFNMAALLFVMFGSTKTSSSPEPPFVALAIVLMAGLSVAGIVAAIDLWKGNPRSRVTGTILFALMAVSASLKWLVQGSAAPLLAGSLIAAWIALACMTAARAESPDGEAVER